MDSQRFKNATMWGSEYPPVNGEEIADALNEAFDMAVSALSETDAEDEDLLSAIAGRLWDDFCTGKLESVPAPLYEE